MNKISVIIRCRDEERWIGHAIQSVLDFVDDPEILIINNKSKDDSLLIVRQFAGFNTVRVLDIDDYSPGKALNLGVQEATNDLILVLSAHCVLKKFDLPNMLEALSTHKAVFGKQHPIYQGKKITPRYLWANFHDREEENAYSKLEDRLFLHNGMCVYRRDILLEHPFDEQLAGKEDRYWARDIVKAGYTYLYSPSLMECDHHWTTDGNTWKGIG